MSCVFFYQVCDITNTSGKCSSCVSLLHQEPACFCFSHPRTMSCYKSASRTCGGWPAGRDFCHLQVLPEPWQRPRDATQILRSPLPPRPQLRHHHQLQESLWGVRSELRERHHLAELCVAGRSHGRGDPNHGSVLFVGSAAEWCTDQREGWSLFLFFGGLLWSGSVCLSLLRNEWCFFECVDLEKTWGFLLLFSLKENQSKWFQRPCD